MRLPSSLHPPTSDVPTQHSFHLPQTSTVPLLPHPPPPPPPPPPRHRSLQPAARRRARRRHHLPAKQRGGAGADSRIGASGEEAPQGVFQSRAWWRRRLAAASRGPSGGGGEGGLLRLDTRAAMQRRDRQACRRQSWRCRRGAIAGEEWRAEAGPLSLQGLCPPMAAAGCCSACHGERAAPATLALVCPLITPAHHLWFILPPPLAEHPGIHCGSSRRAGAAAEAAGEPAVRWWVECCAGRLAGAAC